jgi:hypothetical protein
MNVIKELKALNKNANINRLIENAMEQRKIWDQKAHILKVISFVGEIEDLVDNKVFERDNISFMNIASYGSNTSNHIGIILLSSKYDMIKNPKSKEYKNFFNAVSNLNDFDIKNTRGAFSAYVDLKKDIVEQVYKFLLSKELRDMLDYSEEQLQIQENEPKSKYRHKI